MAHDHGENSCCCGCMHVRKGAFIIGILGVVFSIIGIIGSIVSGIWYNIIYCAIGLIVSGLIIFADKTEREWAYLPYIVLQAIGIVINALAAIGFLVLGIVLPKGLEDHLNIDKDKDWDTVKTALRVACFIYVFCLIISEIIAIWFWLVVFKAYKYMKNMMGGGHAYPHNYA
uniref:Uncharacterized protein n=1 Tax=Acrobeloides nanus TaxID=290746 RepID=A0A914CC67_9BILA